MGKKEVSGSLGGGATVVLTVDLHCEGCAHKVKRTIKHLVGVESVNTDLSARKITVTGKVDPVKIKEKVEKRIKKKVELVSPQPPPPPIKKENDGGDSSGSKNVEKENDGDGGGGKNVEKENGGDGGGENSDVMSEKKPPPQANDNKRREQKKPKEPEVTTVVLKTKVHCDGCAQKINKIINKCEGVKEVSVDLAKNQITLKGTMDMAQILPYLNAKFKREVEIVASPPPKKDEGGNKNPKDEKGKGVVSNGGDKKKKKKIDEYVSEGGEGGSKMVEEENVSRVEVVNKMENLAYQIGYPYNPQQVHGNGYNPQQAHGYGYAEYWNGPDYMQAPDQYHAPQMFSDENPNACSIM